MADRASSPSSTALDRLKEIGPTVAFLAGILVFGHLCAEAGVFDYLGSLAARASDGRPRRLLALVVVLAALVTAVLTLDATVVLLTPVVLTTVPRLGVPARPHAYACTRLANSGSLLLPVSNLTNLLAFAACGLSFGRFAALMVLPWVLACAAEWLGLRTVLPRATCRPEPVDRRADAVAAPRYALAVLGADRRRLRRHVARCTSHRPGRRSAAACCCSSPRLRRARRARCARWSARPARGSACSCSPSPSSSRRSPRTASATRSRTSCRPATGPRRAAARRRFVAAALANLVNNLPATLALVPLVAGSPALVLAVLVGVNVGPNLTYGGSLATLLWRRLLPADAKPERRRVPPARRAHRAGDPAGR